MKIHDYGRPAPPATVRNTWTTAELQADFQVHGFAAPFVLVTRKSDGAKGTLEFTHSPRLYFDFQETTE